MIKLLLVVLFLITAAQVSSQLQHNSSLIEEIGKTKGRYELISTSSGFIRTHAEPLGRLGLR
ncbi:MAG: hypothetical protein MK066_08025 [Crocinitomicaceae bacterium]|nr:hypothetical protein [Crocinitomicaceae bacterium]